MSTKSFEKSKDKQTCRDLLCQIASHHLQKINTIITLPSKEMLCVKTFKKYFPKASVIGIERDPEIAELITTKGVLCFNATIEEYVNKMTLKQPHCDIFFMDYYSHMSQVIMNEMFALIANDNIIHKSKPTIIGITLSKAIRHDKGETLAFLKRHIWDKDEVLNTAEDIAQGIYGALLNQFPYLSCINIESIVEYKTGISMYFIILKITK